MKTSLKPRHVVLLTLVVFACITAARVPKWTGSVKAQQEATVRAAGRGRPYLNLRDGHAIEADAYAGGGGEVSLADDGGAPAGIGGPRALSLASGDFNTDGAPDLVSGSSDVDGGVITLRRGNIDAFAPRNAAVFAAVQQGQLPASFLEGSRTFALPDAPDFLLAGDFDRDGLKDVLAAARGGASLYLLKGDGAGNFSAAQAVQLPGAVTALTSGGFNRGDGGSDVVVGVTGAGGAEALIFSRASGGLTGTPTHYALPAPATSFALGEMDEDSYSDLAAAAGNEVSIIHAPGNGAASSARVEHVAVSSGASSVAFGYFVWNREQRKSLAVLSNDGSLRLIQPVGVNRTPYTAAERAQLSTGDQEVLAVTQNWAAQPAHATWQPGSEGGWSVSAPLGVSAPSTEGASAQLFASNLTYEETSTLVVLNPATTQVNIVRHLGELADAAAAGQAASAASQLSVALDAAGAPVAFTEMPRKVNGERDLVLIMEGHSVPSAVPLAPAFTITVDRTDDVAAASGCVTGTANDCSLRGAVTYANTHAGGVQINVPAGTYSLSGAASEDSNASGDLDLLSTASGVVFVGAGATTTIITPAAGDRIFQVTPGTTPVLNWAGSWAGLTMQNANVSAVLSGGSILMGGTDNVYAILNCTFNNNVITGNIASNGGAVAQSAKQTGGAGQATVVNSTFTSNRTQTGVGGAYRVLGGTSSAGTEFLNITGGLFNNNEATTNEGGAVFLTIQSGTSNFSKIQFTNNKAVTTGTASDTGGGAIQKSNGTLNVNFSRFRGNTVGAGGKGEGVKLGGNGDLIATNNWWGCNTDPYEENTSPTPITAAANCDSAYKVTTVTGTLDTTPRLMLKNTASPAPIVTGQDTTLTATVNSNSDNADVSANVIVLVDQAVVWSNPVNGALSNQQNALQSLTSNIAASPTGATESGTTVTITTTAAHGFTAGKTVLISGIADPRYNGTFTINATPTTTTFTVTNPITGLPASGGGTAKVSVGTATATFRAAHAGTGNADATMDGATATAVFTINKANTTATITSDTPDPTVTGEPFTVNFSLAVNAPGSNNPTVPTGNVTVSDGVNSCTAAIAANGTGTCNIALFNAGNRSLTATYAGDADFNASPASSPATPHLVNKADTTTTITSDNPDPSVTGQTVAVNYSVAVVSPGAGTPTGNVVVTDNGNAFCTGTVAAGTCSAALTTAGSHTFVATYQGDANYNASPASADATHTVNKADTTAAVTGDTPDPTVRNQSFTVTYSVSVTSPGAGTPTGNVLVSDGVESCTGTVAAGQCTLTLTTVGSRSITATYQGDSNFNASPASSGASHTVNKSETTTLITSDTPDPSFTNAAVPINYTVALSGTGTGVPTGSVVVTISGGAETCTGGLDAAGTGSCNLTITAAGSRTITATYQGDTNFNGSSDTEAHDSFAPPDIFVRDARVTEPSSGSANMIFTVTLSAPSTNNVTVDFATADDTGGTNPATVGSDYTFTSGSFTFTPGQTFKTISVPVLADLDSPENDETFLVNLSNVVGAVVADSQAVGTITQTQAASQVLITEMRTSGPGASGTGNVGDDYVEVYNNSDSQLTVQSTDGSAGWALVASNNGCTGQPVIVGVIPNGTPIPARGHYLFVGSAYSLTSYAASNQTLSSDLGMDVNVALFSTSNLANLSSVNRLDGVGFGLNTADVCDLLREATTLNAANDSTSQYAYVRKFTLQAFNVPTPTDTHNSAADFYVVSTTPATPVGTTSAPLLGAPGPEGSAPGNSSPNLKKYDQVGAQVLDPAASQSSAPNRVRRTCADPSVEECNASRSALGTLSIRRTFTNNTLTSINRLRFRIYDVSAFPSPSGTADIRAISSSQISVTVTGGATVTVQGTTLDNSAAQPLGGAMNSSVTTGFITPANQLAPGASVNVQFLFGVQQGGAFRVFVFVEALP